MKGGRTTPGEHRYCQGCLEKLRKIDRLDEKVRQLQAKLRRQERTAREGFFGVSTPSSKVPVKAGSKEEAQARQGGGKPGHAGHGRKSLEPEQADRVERIGTIDLCPDCGIPLRIHKLKRRTVIDCAPVQKCRKVFEIEEKCCPGCKRRFRSHPPGVLPKALYGNQLLALVAVEHYADGLTLGYIEKQTGVPYSSLVQSMQMLAAIFKNVPDRLVQLYQQAPVKHADETGWRDNGCNGYAWLFCTPDLSLFRFRGTRSGSVAREVFGDAPHTGTLVVDRYGGYNRYTGPVQHCYAHLHRETEKLTDEFPDNPEIRDFVDAFAPLLADAMGLHNQKLDDAQYARTASQIRDQIVTLTNTPAKHPAVQNIQNIFREKADRLFQWVSDRRVPADNNRAERELRPLVVARKISFGSQSQKGARTREILMSILLTLRKRTPNLLDAFKNALDRLAANTQLDAYDALLPADSS